VSGTAVFTAPLWQTFRKERHGKADDVWVAQATRPQSQETGANRPVQSTRDQEDCTHAFVPRFLFHSHFTSIVSP